MKKRIVALCLALVLILSLTACIRFEATVKINKNGTADVRMLMAASDALASMGNGGSIGFSEEEIAEYKTNGYEYEEYTDDDASYTGFIISRKGLDLQSGEKNGDEMGVESIIDGDMFKVDGKHVTIDFAMFSESDYEELGSYLSMLKSYGGYMKFILELPAKPTNHNATTVSEDGKTLTWDLTKFKANEKVHAEFDMPSSILTWLLPIIGVILVAIVVVVLIKKKKSNVASEAILEEADSSKASVTSSEETNNTVVD